MPAVFPIPSQVLIGVTYGPITGTEYVGTAPLFVEPGTSSGVSATGHNDLVEEAVRLKIEAALPKDWNCYARRDMNILNGDQFPLCYVVGLNTIDLEEETDNRVLVGYPQAVLLAVVEGSIQRTDSDLIGLRRIAQQAVYTTSYPTLAAAGLSVENITIDEALGTAPPQRDDITWMGFMVTPAILESREVAST